MKILSQDIFGKQADAVLMMLRASWNAMSSLAATGSPCKTATEAAFSGLEDIEPASFWDLGCLNACVTFQRLPVVPCRG